MVDTRRLLAAFVLSAFFISGCGSQETMHIQVATAPDLAIYDGVYFESRDGMKTYDDIVLVPRLLRDKVPLLLPDGSGIDVRDTRADILRAHGVAFESHQDDGKGTYSMTCEDGLQANVTSDLATSVRLFKKTPGRSPFSIQLKGYNLAVPIKRVDLEALLGKPDETKLDTWPPR